MSMSLSFRGSHVRRLAMVLAGLTAMAFAWQAQAAEKVFVEDGYAIGGWDPVAYFTEGRPVEGKPEFALEHEGATWLFSSAANRDRFAADPQRYAPQYGGFCAYGVSQGYKVSIEPELWTIVDGKLYLNYSPSVQRTWEEDIPGYIAEADERWPNL